MRVTAVIYDKDPQLAKAEPGQGKIEQHISTNCKETALSDWTRRIGGAGSDSVEAGTQEQCLLLRSSGTSEAEAEEHVLLQKSAGDFQCGRCGADRGGNAR